MMNRHKNKEPCTCGACARAGAVKLVRAHYTARQDAARARDTARARAALKDFGVYEAGIGVSMVCAAAFAIHVLF